jgi:sec-independent protein translocase protein TatA
MSIGPPELILVLVIVLIIFGVGRLPQVGGALGRSIREFREASEGKGEPPAPPAPPAATAIPPDETQPRV